MIIRKSQDVPGAHTKSPPKVNPRPGSTGACVLCTTPAPPQRGDGVILVGQGCYPAPTSYAITGCHNQNNFSSFLRPPTHHGAQHGETWTLLPSGPRGNGGVYVATTGKSGDHLAHSHADQPIDLSEPREAARLGRNKGPKRRVASPSAQLRHRSTSRTPVSQHFGSPHTANMWEDMKGGMYQPVLKVGTPCNLTHSWGWMAIDSPGVHLPFAWCCFSSTGVSITPSSLKSIQ